MGTKFDKCPKCGRSSAGSISNTFYISECRKCGQLFCKECGGERCPKCGSRDKKDAGYVKG